MPDGAVGFINHSAPFFLHFHFHFHVLHVAEHGGTRLRHQVQPKFCPGSQAQCVQNVNKVTFQLKCCIGKKVGEGSNFCVWWFCPPHRLRSL